MLKEFNVRTRSKTELLDITNEVFNAIEETGVKEGIAIVYVPHTTAGVTINENADPSVKRDILMELNKVIPFDDNYSHLEGNAAAHIKSSIIGASINLIIKNGRPILGTWQGIFFCEFDGPRTRKVFIKVL
ncbi:MAG: YjbQ family protein [Deltaproteobacteria bacterium]|nr:YjbQ family protein [Deltaproteobacteria bacterium]